MQQEFFISLETLSNTSIGTSEGTLCILSMVRSVGNNEGITAWKSSRAKCGSCCVEMDLGIPFIFKFVFVGTIFEIGQFQLDFCDGILLRMRVH